MTCRIDHDAASGLPEFLCRVCHPELNTTPEEYAKLDAADREKLVMARPVTAPPTPRKRRKRETKQ